MWGVVSGHFAFLIVFACLIFLAGMEFDLYLVLQVCLWFGWLVFVLVVCVEFAFMTCCFGLAVGGLICFV